MNNGKVSTIFSFFLLMALLGCKAKKEIAQDAVTLAAKEAPAAATIVNLLGSYVGSFGDNKITLLITKATKDSVEGRSVVGGNDRPFSGTITQSGNIFSVAAKEPGGDPHDGQFDFTIDGLTPDQVKGSWKPFNQTGKITSKEYTLQRRSFAYLKNTGTYPQASGRLLKDADVDNLVSEELELMRNEIFARHGYCFKKKHTREQFENMDWYIPNTTDVKNDLTEVERKNISLIKKFEQYAADYGDEFGR